ncbi:CatB-related O-acetyltransferase [Chryseomicrobium aureum]|uniref:CatB-related O-acetyltransferase n=1 Tax=Chryseomicrobium aureum TaxID=1441723 RepID=UPI00370DE233
MIKYIISKLLIKIQLPSIKNSNIHRTSKVMSKSNVVRVLMDKYSYIGNNCTIVDTKIGAFCSIADNCIIGGASHPIDWISTSPVFHSGKNILKTNFSNHKFNVNNRTIIGNDVWIGNNVLIKSGIKISDGAIIGMGSILTKDVGPYEIWAGNPAKLIRTRFDEGKIQHLLNVKWWEFDDKKLKKYSFASNKLEEFIKEVKDEDSVSNI